MKNSTLISIIALMVSIVGIMIALVAYFKRRSCVLCDDMEDDMVEFYEDDDGFDCHEDCSCCKAEDDTAAAPAAPATTPENDGTIKF